MDALIRYDNEDQNVPGNNEGPEPGAAPRPDQNPGDRAPIGPYMDKCLLRLTQPQAGVITLIAITPSP